MSRYVEVGCIRLSNTGHSCKIYFLDDEGKRIFIGVVSRRSLHLLLLGEILQADISRFTEATEPLIFKTET